MTIDLHYVCKHGLNHRHLGDQVHESGEWVATDDLAEKQLVGDSTCMNTRRIVHGTAARS